MSNIKVNKVDAPLLDDYVFKRTFTRDDPNGILKDFLEAVLKIKIHNVQVLNAEIPKDLLDERGSVLDVRAELDNNRIVDIEMQLNDEGNIDKRSSVYMSKNIATQIKTSEDYKGLKPSIVINILNFNRYKRNSYHSVAHMKFEKTRDENYINLGYTNEEKEATDMLEMHIIELPKYRRKKGKTYTKKEQWLSLIAGGKEKKMARLDEPKVKEALKLVEEVLADSKERDLYESRKLAKYDRYCVRKHGIEEGKNSERRKIIKRLRKHGMSNKEISKMMEINLTEVEKVI